MLKKALTLLCISYASVSFADSISNYRTAMIDRCANDGEQKGICECAYKQWSQSVNNGNESTAIAFAKAMSSNTPPAAQHMAKMQPLIMAYQKAGMQCATTEYQEEDNNTDVAALIPNLPQDQANLLNGIANGNMSNQEVQQRLKKLDANNERQRKMKQEKRQQQAQKQQAEYEKRKQVFKQELAKIDARRPISKIPYQEMKKAFYASMRINGQNTEVKIKCLWNAADTTATNDGAGSWFIYDLVVGGGDYDHPEDYKPYGKKALKLWQSYQTKIDRCF